MKKIISSITVLILLVSLVGCGSSSTSGTKKTNEKQQEFLKGL